MSVAMLLIVQQGHHDEKKVWGFRIKISRKKWSTEITENQRMYHFVWVMIWLQRAFSLRFWQHRKTTTQNTWDNHNIVRHEPSYMAIFSDDVLSSPPLYDDSHVKTVFGPRFRRVDAATNSDFETRVSSEIERISRSMSALSFPRELFSGERTVPRFTILSWF